MRLNWCIIEDEVPANIARSAGSIVNAVTPLGNSIVVNSDSVEMFQIFVSIENEGKCLDRFV